MIEYTQITTHAGLYPTYIPVASGQMNLTAHTKQLGKGRLYVYPSARAPAL